MTGKLFISAVVVVAAALSGCAMCDNCDDNAPPVALDSIEGVSSPTGRAGSVLSGAPIVESFDSFGAAGSGTQIEPSPE